MVRNGQQWHEPDIAAPRGGEPRPPAWRDDQQWPASGRGGPDGPYRLRPAGEPGRPPGRRDEYWPPAQDYGRPGASDRYGQLPPRPEPPPRRWDGMPPGGYGTQDRRGPDPRSGAGGYGPPGYGPPGYGPGGYGPAGYGPAGYGQDADYSAAARPWRGDGRAGPGAGPGERPWREPGYPARDDARYYRERWPDGHDRGPSPSRPPPIGEPRWQGREPSWPPPAPPAGDGYGRDPRSTRAPGPAPARAPADSAGAPASPRGAVVPPLALPPPTPHGGLPNGSVVPLTGPAVAAGPDDETAPLPVMLHEGTERTRGPFEPIARPPDADAGPPEPEPSVADAKLDQIKDLYFTAEAIGENALAQHFQQVSDRQRQLIREFFNREAADRTGEPGK